jgi:cell wall-associated NlpC family hydrolase
MLFLVARLAPALVLVLVVLGVAGRPAQASPGPQGVVDLGAEVGIPPAGAPPAGTPGADGAEQEAAAEATAEARAKARAKARRKTEAYQRDAVVRFARAQLGKPYVWGATGPRSYDCSGLIQAAYGSIGRRIPRTTFGQLARLRTPGRIERGDLVFGIPGHVAMYIGHGRVIHAPAPGRRIQIAAAGWHMGYARRTVFA